MQSSDDLNYEFRQRLMNSHFIEAVVETSRGRQKTVIETRFLQPDLKLNLLTKINDEIVRADSIESLLRNEPNCLRLTIDHDVEFISAAARKSGRISEIYRRLPESELGSVAKLRLEGDSFQFETDWVFAIAEAWSALHIWQREHEIQWIPQICHSCNFAMDPFHSGLSDGRHFRCYRDAPEEFFREVKEELKAASSEAWSSGHFFVHSFHRCAAWEPNYMKPPPSID